MLALPDGVNGREIVLRAVMRRRQDSEWLLKLM